MASLTISSRCCLKPIERSCIHPNYHRLGLSVLVEGAEAIFSADPRIFHAAPRRRRVVAMVVIDPNDANLRDDEGEGQERRGEAMGGGSHPVYPRLGGLS
jgi:hypothetical protein